MKLTTLKQKYKDKWVLAEVLSENKSGIVDVKPIKISDKRDDIYQMLPKLKKGAHVATLYTGEIPEKGSVFAFVCHS